MNYNSVFISDCHLGCSNDIPVNKLIQFFKDNNFNNLFILGDFFDLWAIAFHPNWKIEYNELLKILLSLSDNVKIKYIIGNHDDLDFLTNTPIKNIQILKSFDYCTNSKKFFLCHGDQFDKLAKNKQFAFWVTFSYNVLLCAAGVMKCFRRFLKNNNPYKWERYIYSLAHQVNAQYDLEDFEKQIFQYARENKYDGVFCGHIHQPKMIKNDVLYINCGDMVTSMSLVVENLNESFEIINF